MELNEKTQKQMHEYVESWYVARIEWEIIGEEMNYSIDVAKKIATHMKKLYTYLPQVQKYTQNGVNSLNKENRTPYNS